MNRPKPISSALHAPNAPATASDGLTSGSPAKSRALTMRHSAQGFAAASCSAADAACADWSERAVRRAAVSERICRSGSDQDAEHFLGFVFQLVGGVCHNLVEAGAGLRPAKEIRGRDAQRLGVGSYNVDRRHTLGGFPPRYGALLYPAIDAIPDLLLR